ncbi:MAG: sulfate ABC transporter substrate-binding protein [Mycobacterium sp.]
MTRSRLRTAVAVALCATVVAACGDENSAANGAAEGTRLYLVAYSVAEPGWSAILPAFADTPAGRKVEVRTSYGASGNKSHAVVDGLVADIVNFSDEPDVTRLVSAEMVPADWNSDATRGIPFGSVVSLVVRQGNPENIRGWDDLLRPGVEVVTPNPLTSGSAKWNLLAPYAVKSHGGQDPDAGLEYVDQLLSEHVRVWPESAAEAADLFLEGTGDVLLSYENEAIRVQRDGDPIEYVNPLETFKIENPVAVLSSGTHVTQATALKNFLFTPQGQRIWAQAGFRPVDPAVAQEFSGQFPPVPKLWTIDDLGGWEAVEPALFDKDHGAITTIYQRATG